MARAWKDDSEEGVTKAAPCTQCCKAGVLLCKDRRRPRVAVLGDTAPDIAVPRHIAVRNLGYATALLGTDDVISMHI